MIEDEKLLKIRTECFAEATHKFWFNDKKVVCREYGAGAELVDEYGQLVADFPSHLNLDWMVDNFLKLVE